MSLSFLSRRQTGRDEQTITASDVKNAYAARIERFFRHVGAPSPGKIQGDPLDFLFTWVNSIIDEKVKTEQQLAFQTTTYQNTERQRQELSEAYERVDSELRRALNEKKNLQGQYERDISSITIDHSRSINELQMKSRNELASQSRKHEDQVRAMIASHKVKVDKLVGQLLVNQDDSLEWPDDKLKLKFRELQRLVESVTSPRKREFAIPPNQQVADSLDPTGFIRRVGRGHTHFLLKSTIWTIFCEQFFGAPFGFGALGLGEGQKELMNVYSGWLKLFENPHDSRYGSQASLVRFQYDHPANKWRTTTFQAINEASDGRNSAANSPLAKLRAENVNKTVTRILFFLSEIAKLSQNVVGSEVRDEIRHMTELAGDIGLQFGVQLAQVQLLAPQNGETIEIGDDFHDCFDGGQDKGALYRVDLIPGPGLQKIGDGRSDTTSKRIIVPCQVYTNQLSS